MIALPRPYLVFTGDLRNEVNAKTAYGVRDWAPESCAGQWSLPGCTIDLALPVLTPAEARAKGVKSLLIGAAPPGGALPAHWIGAVVEALEAGLDIVSGLHTPLGSFAEIAAAAAKSGGQLIDIRHGQYERRVGTGIKRSGKRLLTVGTDCALGKKYTALSITRAMQAAGWDASFRATGQTGIMISGEGAAIDAVVADFISGVAEQLSPDAAPAHWDVIEGQGSLFHPAYAAVTLGLLHGSQPDAMVLCHHPTRERINGFEGYRLPTLTQAMELHLPLARRTNPDSRIVAVALNTKGLDEAATAAAIAAAGSETGLPAFDPIKHDLSPLLAQLETL
ncbi:DUF1611 domain-containing protein [Sphingomonas canadensis]|uniref:DUF1611 domain-containing protein n=1 Tax=Sphingomonas canadensis TaxID=1219257 RepID=A0ABW3H7C2_9SPHN|nr:DUF1611 domain-containing protein [Sphingomonas canadensis]MCW3836962.1 DUF1611 domain-containing protein [Sphingomonas canadensis]